MISSRSLATQLAGHHCRLRDGSVAPPAILPLDESGPFPVPTWHADMPDIHMDTLQQWTDEGLHAASQQRIRNVISVYSLGFHQLVRSVRAGMAAPSSTVANLWKMFVFLLNDCMPDGSVYALRIAAMERAQSIRARELIAGREAELSRLLGMESSLQQSVRDLDHGLRAIQAHRQEAEDARLEALDSIDEQESLQIATKEEISELEAQAERWKQKFQLASNRHRMLAEDARQYQRMQFELKKKYYDMGNEVRRKPATSIVLDRDLPCLIQCLTCMFSSFPSTPPPSLTM